MKYSNLHVFDFFGCIQPLWCAYSHPEKHRHVPHPQETFILTERSWWTSQNCGHIKRHWTANGWYFQSPDSILKSYSFTTPWNIYEAAIANSMTHKVVVLLKPTAINIYGRCVFHRSVLRLCSLLSIFSILMEIYRLSCTLLYGSSRN